MGLLSVERRPPKYQKQQYTDSELTTPNKLYPFSRGCETPLLQWEALCRQSAISQVRVFQITSPHAPHKSTRAAGNYRPMWGCSEQGIQLITDHCSGNTATCHLSLGLYQHDSRNDDQDASNWMLPPSLQDIVPRRESRRALRRDKICGCAPVGLVALLSRKL